MAQFETNTKRGSYNVQITFTQGSLMFGVSSKSFTVGGDATREQITKLRKRLGTLLGNDDFPSQAVRNRMTTAELRELLLRSQPTPVRDIVERAKTVAGQSNTVQQFVDSF